MTLISKRKPASQVAPMPLHLAFTPNRHVGATLRVFIDW